MFLLYITPEMKSAKVLFAKLATVPPAFRHSPEGAALIAKAEALVRERDGDAAVEALRDELKFQTVLNH